MSKILVFVKESPALWWTLDEMWTYILNHKDDDPLGIFKLPQNKYAIGRAKAYGLEQERKEKYGRE